MEDFCNIIVYYMDTDLQELFISKSPPDLGNAVKAIADDDPVANPIFCKKLQTA
jgi:hypothetical protein